MHRSRGRRTSASSGCEGPPMSARAKSNQSSINRVLVANRGEIARRVFATCRRLGIATVAVYTDPDASSPHVAEADARVRLDGPNGYLDAGQMIAAARASGADALHP